MEAAPIEFWQGVEQFNQREFYACHDTLEALWIEAMEPNKRFYQGILQIAVGLYHLGNQNWRGAVILLGEGMHRLQGYPDDYHDINVEALLAQSSQILKLLHETGPEQVMIALQQLGYEQPNDRPAATAPSDLSLPVIQKLT